MTQVVTALTIAMAFTGLSIQIARFQRRGVMGETNIPVQELWLEMGGGLMHERERMGRILQYILHGCMHIYT